MTNKLIFVDMPSSDPVAMQAFYEELFGWQINPRPEGEFHQIVPGDGLHLGIFNAETRPPDPAPTPLPERGGVEPRVYILVDDTPVSYLDKAVALGATKLWDELYWEEFNGYHASFRDPWGNHIVMWQPKDDRDKSSDSSASGG